MPANRSRLVALIAGAGCALLPFDAAFAADPTGVWMNDTGRGAIEIRPCGAALCGHVVWVKDPTDTKGCGRQIIGNAAKVGANVWDNGWIYSPEKKKKYDVELKPLGSGKLQVTGYAGSKFFSKTMVWTRAPANLGRCGQSETIAKAESKTDPKPKSKPETTAKAAGAKPVVTAKTEADTKAKTKAVAKSEPKIVPPAPKPAERPAAKPDTAAPTTVARAEPEGTAVLATPAPARKAPPAAPPNAPAAPDAAAAPAPNAATGAATGPATDADPPPAPSADTATQPQGEVAPQAGHPVPDPVEPGVADAEVDQAPHEKGLDMGLIAKRLAELERETGYGLKKAGDGNCRLKVPFATVNFPCKE